MGYGQTLAAHGAEGTPGFFAEYDKIRTRFNAYTTVQASITDPDFAGGADPTGVADSAAAITACWAAAAPYSMIVYPPASAGQATYRILSGLTHPAKPLFHWSPRGAAVIKHLGASGSNVWDSNGADFWTIDGLTLDANYPTRTSGRTLQLSGSTDFRVTNFRIQNSADMGIALGAGCARFSIDHFIITSTELSGIWFGEGTGTVEDFWITDGYLTNTNIGNAVGHAAVQSSGPGGVAATMTPKQGHFRDVIAEAYTRVGFGMDFITDSEFINCEARGSHTGEAFALTGARNRVYGGRYGESTGAAGLLLWCWAGNDQNNEDTIIDGVYLPGPGSGNQGLALVNAENSVTMKRMLIHGVRAHGWNYGIQSYNGAAFTGWTDDGTLLIRDNHLTGNATGGYIFATITPVLRGNLTAADTIDA